MKWRNFYRGIYADMPLRYFYYVFAELLWRLCGAFCCVLSVDRDVSALFDDGLPVGREDIIQLRGNLGGTRMFVVVLQRADDGISAVCGIFGSGLRIGSAFVGHGQRLDAGGYVS